MAHMEIEETLALIENLRDLAQDGDLGEREHDDVAKRRLVELTDEISERVAQLDDRLGEDEVRPAVAGGEHLEALGRIAAEVGHRINNLLAALATRMELTEICLRERDSERGMSNFRLARDYLHQVETIAVSLIDYAGAPAKPLRSDLNEIVRSTVSFARLLGPYENIDFEMELAGDLQAVTIDPARWQQLLLSLIANGADAVGRRKGEGGRIRISTGNATTGPSVLLTVQDEGRGIARDDIPRVFEPGFTTKGAGREGLGLTTCRRIVEEAGGEIGIESEPDRGTTVTITLPVKR